jgi:gliding motility-associated-like protein
MPAGDYLPEDPFANFIGTPLNGLWCLNIIDNLNIDNGYIFEWGINFNPAIIPTAGSYEPGEVIEEWEANGDITATNGTVITVTPTTAGQNCYNFSFTDNFGCTYVETVCIDVAPEITAALPNDIIVCQSTGAVTVDLTLRDAQILNGLDDTLYTLTTFNSTADANAALNPVLTPAAYDVSADETLFVRVEEVASGCFIVVELNVFYSTAQYNTVADIEACDDPTNLDGREIFDLTSQEAAILGSQDPTEFTVGYFLNQSDADANTNAISTPEAFESMGETIYVRVSNSQDADCYDTGTFNLVVESCEVLVPEGFSPNNDGINDTFSIPGIDQFANFELKIFNRLGSVVYETRASNYVEFAGIPNSGLNSGDGLLPTGTYFYVIKFNDPDTEDVARWVYINY